MGIYLLSARKLISNVSEDPIFELEDLLVQTCNAHLLMPVARGVTKLAHQYPPKVTQWMQKVIRRTGGLHESIADLALDAAPNVLLIIALNGSWLEMLPSIPDWRKRFDVVATYVFDGWLLETYPRYTKLLDHLFVPMPEIVDELHQHLGIPVSLLPFGSDVMVHGSYQGDRAIDLISYGRIPAEHNRAFATAFNHPGSDRLYFRSTPRRQELFPKQPYELRRDLEDTAQLYQMLRKSRIALAYDTMYPGMRVFPHPFVTLRWFQCGGAGCAIAGKRPTTPLADELLDWEDSTIELPDDPQGGVEVITSLLVDPDRLERIRQRNYLENLGRHDWRSRIKDMLQTLEVSLPSPLAQQLAHLQECYAQTLHQFQPF